MARCDVPGCRWYGKAAGKPIHMAKVHGIHPEHEDMSDIKELTSEVTILIPHKLKNIEIEEEQIPCPHCKTMIDKDKMREHWVVEHPSWQMGDGRFVFEVRDE